MLFRSIQQINYGDVLLYLDSGISVINDLRLLPLNKDVISFEMFDKQQKDWTKYDTFYIMDCLEDKYINCKQKQAGMQIYTKTDKSLSFIKEYLSYCLIERCIDDSKSIYGKDFDSFVENRHDQSIFTNLCIKYNISTHRDPTQWGNQFVEKYNDSYPQILNHHRGLISV